MAAERIQISGRVLRTPDLTIRLGDAWVLQQYHWPRIASWYNPHPVSALAIGILVASIAVLSRSGGPDQPWAVYVAFGGAVGATWSIGRSVLSRWVRPEDPSQLPSRGITLGGLGSEGAATVFTSEDEQEIALVRQGLEQTLLATT
jgi:hypothetical protein